MCVFFGRAARKRQKRDVALASESGSYNSILPEEFPDGNMPSAGTVNGPVADAAKTGENHTDTFYHDKLVSFWRKVTAPDGANSISTTILQVRHYAEYTIEVKACQDPVPDAPVDLDRLCSMTAVTSVRTKQLGKPLRLSLSLSLLVVCRRIYCA